MVSLMQKLTLHPNDPLFINISVVIDPPLDAHIQNYYYGKYGIYSMSQCEKLHAIIDYYHSQGYEYKTYFMQQDGARIIMKYYPHRIEKNYKMSGKYSEQQTIPIPIRFNLKYEMNTMNNAIIRIQQDF